MANWITERKMIKIAIGIQGSLSVYTYNVFDRFKTFKGANRFNKMNSITLI